MTATPTLRGLTWDHPRGYRALFAAAERARADGLDLVWDKQPLEGFESAPIADLAARYDLVVMDHPHVGEAVAAGCFRPLDTVFDPPFLDALARDAAGPGFASYVYAGRPWALPLDAATQIMALRHELAGEAPATWDGVADLARRRPMALSLAGPHAVLTLSSIAVALGEPPASRDPDRFLSEQGGRAALGVLRELHGLRAKAADGLNPIGIYEAMSRGDALAFCPLVFGYVNYARAEDGRQAIRFADAPAAQPGGRPGSTLGGTSIAISTRCAPTPALVAHLKWLMAPETQAGFIPAEAGQPGLLSAWDDPAVNAAWGNFYADTRRTIEAAWVRPRHPGYIAFQTEASALIRDGLEGGDDGALLGRLQDRYAASRTAGGEI